MPCWIWLFWSKQLTFEGRVMLKWKSMIDILCTRITNHEMCRNINSWFPHQQLELLVLSLLILEGGSNTNLLYTWHDFDSPTKTMHYAFIYIWSPFLCLWRFDCLVTCFLFSYPTDTDKLMLAKQTGLSRSQVNITDKGSILHCVFGL